MQQPDYRDQSESELEVKSETEENSQSDSNKTQNHETGQLEQEGRETDDALVSFTKSQSFTTKTLDNLKGPSLISNRSNISMSSFMLSLSLVHTDEQTLC